MIEHSPALRQSPSSSPSHRLPSERTAAPTQRALSRARSRYYAAVPRLSFLPSFLSLPNDVFPAIGFLREQWLGGRIGSREGEKHEEKGVDNAHPLLIHWLFLCFMVYMYKMKERRRRRRRGERRKSDRRIYRGARKEATGPDQLEVIPWVESPASQSMKFFLSPRCTDLPEEWPSLFLRSLLSHTYPWECISALDRMYVHVLTSASSSSALIAPYPPPRAKRGIRALIRANYTGGSQFNFTYRASRLHDPQLDVSIIDLL